MTDPDTVTLRQALEKLGQIRNLPAYTGYLHHLGVFPPFRNGAEAVELIRQRGIKVVFGDMGDSSAHAQWIAEENTMMINRKYRGDLRNETLYAIAAAIYHEAGHAAGNGDNQSSVQEEMNCLALNTLAHIYFCSADPAYAQASASSSSPLLANGVALYPKLFFDPDPNKQALINRVIEKYGDLPIASPGHNLPAPNAQPLPMVYRVVQALEQRKVQAPASNPPAYQAAAPPASPPQSQWVA